MTGLWSSCDDRACVEVDIGAFVWYRAQEGAFIDMKMYLLVRRSVPIGFALVAVAHASLAAYLKFRDHPDVAAWLAGPFRKVICAVSDEEFEAAKRTDDSVVITESALGGAEVAIAFRPRSVWPESFRSYQLYRA